MTAIAQHVSLLLGEALAPLMLAPFGLLARRVAGDAALVKVRLADPVDSGLLDGDGVLDEVDARGLKRAEERALDLHVLGLVRFSM